MAAGRNEEAEGDEKVGASGAGRAWPPAATRRRREVRRGGEARGRGEAHQWREVTGRLAHGGEGGSPAQLEEEREQAAGVLFFCWCEDECEPIRRVEPPNCWSVRAVEANAARYWHAIPFSETYDIQTVDWCRRIPIPNLELQLTSKRSLRHCYAVC
jgi:hypothetical protein